MLKEKPNMKIHDMCMVVEENLKQTNEELFSFFFFIKFSKLSK